MFVSSPIVCPLPSCNSLPLGQDSFFSLQLWLFLLYLRILRWVIIGFRAMIPRNWARWYEKARRRATSEYLWSNPQNVGARWDLLYRTLHFEIILSPKHNNLKTKTKSYKQEKIPSHIENGVEAASNLRIKPSLYEWSSILCTCNPQLLSIWKKWDV